MPFLPLTAARCLGPCETASSAFNLSACDPYPHRPKRGNGVEREPPAGPPRKPRPDRMKRRAAVEPVIGHTKAEHRMGRNYLKGRGGDRSNAVLAAAGYNFSLLLRWLERLLYALIRALFPAPLAGQTG